MAEGPALTYWTPSEAPFDEIDEHDIYGQEAGRSYDEQVREQYDRLLEQDAALMFNGDETEEEKTAEMVGVALIVLYCLGMLFLLLWSVIGVWFIINIISRWI